MPSRLSQVDLLSPQLGLLPVAQTQPQPSILDPALSLRQQELHLRRQLRRSVRSGDLVEQAACYLSLGDIELSRGDSEQAGELYRRALKLSQSAHDSRRSLARSAGFGK